MDLSPVPRRFRLQTQMGMGSLILKSIRGAVIRGAVILKT